MGERAAIAAFAEISAMLKLKTRTTMLMRTARPCEVSIARSCWKRPSCTRTGSTASNQYHADAVAAIAETEPSFDRGPCPVTCLRADGLEDAGRRRDLTIASAGDVITIKPAARGLDVTTTTRGSTSKLVDDEDDRDEVEDAGDDVIVSRHHLAGARTLVWTRTLLRPSRLIVADAARRRWDGPDAVFRR